MPHGRVRGAEDHDGGDAERRRDVGGSGIVAHEDLCSGDQGDQGRQRQPEADVEVRESQGQRLLVRAGDEDGRQTVPFPQVARDGAEAPGCPGLGGIGRTGVDDGVGVRLPGPAGRQAGAGDLALPGPQVHDRCCVVLRRVHLRVRLAAEHLLGPWNPDVVGPGLAEVRETCSPPSSREGGQPSRRGASVHVDAEARALGPDGPKQSRLPRQA